MMDIRPTIIDVTEHKALPGDLIRTEFGTFEITKTKDKKAEVKLIEEPVHALDHTKAEIMEQKGIKLNKKNIEIFNRLVIDTITVNVGDNIRILKERKDEKVEYPNELTFERNVHEYAIGEITTPIPDTSHVIISFDKKPIRGYYGKTDVAIGIANEELIAFN